MIDHSFWRDRKVFLTGHTGFKGGWLTTWLLELGAKVAGYSLEPETVRSFFTDCGLHSRMPSTFGDIRNAESLRNAIRAFEPEVAIHLAAQSLVRRSYKDPLDTFSVNAIGTANLLDALRGIPSLRAVVIVTSDKCYENRESVWGYREGDPLGGKDPYSASKACAELITATYRSSFFESSKSAVGVATVRAGNVIGGGDWAEDRIFPDAIRALWRGEAIHVRNPSSIRPWQHVLEPLAGYLMLAEKLCSDPSRWSEAWNFGPRDEDAVSVASLSAKIIKEWGGGAWVPTQCADSLREAFCLRLDCSKAVRQLGWRPRLTIDESVAFAVSWYRAALLRAGGGEMYRISCDQIQMYEARLGAESIVHESLH